MKVKNIEMESENKILIFTSNSMNNIVIGCYKNTWAIANPRKNMKTKYEQLKCPCLGLFYCSTEKTYLNPFIIRKKIEDSEFIGTWDDDREFGYGIEILPLSNNDKSVTIDELKELGISFKVGNGYAFQDQDLSYNDLCVLLDRLV